MPVKAKAQATPKVKNQGQQKTRTQITPRAKAKAAPKHTTDELKEANRLRQQRFLEKHRDEVNEQRREKYAARKEAGRCPRCGKKLRSLKLTLCKDCLEKARDYNKN